MHHYVFCSFSFQIPGYRSLAFGYRVGEQTVAGIVDEVCQAIWNQLSKTHDMMMMDMMMAEAEEDWGLIAANFEAKCNFPYCLGAIDGNTIVIKSPSNSGSLYFNYNSRLSNAQ